MTQKEKKHVRVYVPLANKGEPVVDVDDAEVFSVAAM